MSLEKDISGIKEALDIKEGLARAKELYVDTGKMNIRHLKALAAKDPTPQKKYIEWMAGKYVDGHINMRQYNEISHFDDLCNRNQIDQKDIYRYGSPEEVSDAIRQAQRKMEQKKSQKNFEIDEEVLKQIDPADIIYQNKNVVIVRPLTTEKSQLYGKNHKCNKADPHSASAYWCTSTTSGYNRFISYFQSSGDTFYIILPKSIDIVPEERYVKVNVQVAALPKGGGRTVWDFFDKTFTEAEADALFRMWKIPYKKSEKKTKETEE